jgi:hypothetical protein
MIHDPCGDRIIDCHDFEKLSRASGKIKTWEPRTNSVVNFISTDARNQFDAFTMVALVDHEVPIVAVDTGGIIKGSDGNLPVQIPSSLFCWKMVPQTGFEPVTPSLRMTCSTS